MLKSFIDFIKIIFIFSSAFIIFIVAIFLIYNWWTEAIHFKIGKLSDLKPFINSWSRILSNSSSFYFIRNFDELLIKFKIRKKDNIKKIEINYILPADSKLVKQNLLDKLEENDIKVKINYSRKTKIANSISIDFDMNSINYSDKILFSIEQIFRFYDISPSRSFEIYADKNKYLLVDAGNDYEFIPITRLHYLKQILFYYISSFQLMKTKLVD